TPGATRADLREVAGVHGGGGHVERGGWQLLPAASAALALTARLAAHGDKEAAGAERSMRKWWLPLATLAPELAGIDLVVAELLLSASALEWPAAPPGEPPVVVHARKARRLRPAGPRDED